MYSELKDFLGDIRTDRSLWTDGDFLTSTLMGTVATCWLGSDPAQIIKIREHFGDLLSFTSIIFGFVLATLIFVVQLTGELQTQKRLRSVSRKLVAHHIWTVLTHLILLAYIFALWLFARPTAYRSAYWTWGMGIAYGFLVFLLAYCWLQILNQILTLGWISRRLHSLPPQDSQAEDVERSDRNPGDGT